MHLRILSLLGTFSFISASLAADPVSAPQANAMAASSNVSLKKEVQHAIDKGLAWLKTQQASEGFWSSPDYPALTALVLTAHMGDPSEEARRTKPEFIEKGYAYLLRCAHDDGGIYGKDLYNYNTSIAMMALLAANDPKFDPVLRKARNYVIGQQVDRGEKGKMDTPWDGGVGYGQNKERHCDLSNTLMALEALYYSRHLKKGKELDEAKDLNWSAAIDFIQRCQNLPSHNKEAWASDDPDNKGGFIYCPNHSMAGETTLPSGKKALRSYGSMSYAGLLSYIYADLRPEDPRVLAVHDWLRRHYSIDENPGMKADGLFYYYQTMAKALSTSGVQELTLQDGRKVLWREELAKKLLDLQKNEGFWVNESGRWWEKDPILVSAYALISLEVLYRGL